MMPTSSLPRLSGGLAALALLFALPARAQLAPAAASHTSVVISESATGASPSEATAEIDLNLPVGAQSGPFSIGTGSSWPAYGLSGTYRVSNQITAEAILGFFGNVQSLAGRAWYRFKQDPTYDLYAFGQAGVFRYDYVLDTESVLGVGGGAGIELSWAKILDKPDFPPIYTNLDLGLILANFEYYNWSGFSAGGGIHYRFGN